MIEIAHFVQFFSLSFGLVAIYIGISLFNKYRSEALKSFLYVLAGINVIVFVHVMEAFFKLITTDEIYNLRFRNFFLYLIVPLAALRLFISIKFLMFCRQLINKKLATVFNYTAIAIFGIFLLFALVLDFDPEISLIMGGITVQSIHLVLFMAYITGSLWVLWNTKKIKEIKTTYLKPVFWFIIFYATVGLMLRLINFPYHRIHEDDQMLYLGFMALLFNLANVLFLKKAFVNNSKSELIDTERDFKKYNITKREKEIIQLICEGKTNKEIAEKLFITPVTVRDHCSNIFRKTKVNNRTELAAIFHKHYKVK